MAWATAFTSTSIPAQDRFLLNQPLMCLQMRSLRGIKTLLLDLLILMDSPRYFVIRENLLNIQSGQHSALSVWNYSYPKHRIGLIKVDHLTRSSFAGVKDGFDHFRFLFTSVTKYNRVVSEEQV